MWIFGYGSLMGDGWEEAFGCLRRTIAVLDGYRRTFNKASTKNWGSKEAPCPTLGLEEIEGGVCKGGTEACTSAPLAILSTAGPAV